jgi:hypothetical protein
MMTRSIHEPVLMRNLAGRILDISSSGCLIESRRRLDVGTVGRLQLIFGNEQCADDVEVVRCAVIEGTRSLYHVGVRFLWTSPRQVGSIREAVLRHAENQETWVM